MAGLKDPYTIPVFALDRRDLARSFESVLLQRDFNGSQARLLAKSLLNNMMEKFGDSDKAAQSGMPLLCRKLDHGGACSQRM